MPLKWVLNKNLGYFWNLHTSGYLLVPKEHKKLWKYCHSVQKNQKISVWFGQICVSQQIRMLQNGSGAIILGIFGIYTLQAICWSQKNTRNHKNIATVSKQIKKFLSNLVKFLFWSQLKSFKMGLEQKSWVVLESTHFRLSAGTNKTTKNLKTLPERSNISV